MRHGEAEVGGSDSSRSRSQKTREKIAAVVSSWLQRKPTIKVAHWVLPTASPESLLQQLEKISQPPGFDGSPSLEEESAVDVACQT